MSLVGDDKDKGEVEGSRRLGKVVARFVNASYAYHININTNADTATSPMVSSASVSTSLSSDGAVVDKEVDKEVYLLKDFSYELQQSDRIGLVGPNG